MSKQNQGWAWAALAMVLGGLPAAAGSVPSRIPLMKAWRIRPVERLGRLGARFFRSGFDDSGWQVGDIRVGEDPFHSRYVLYRKRLTLPAAWRGKKIAITFEGVDDDAVVYFNGKKVASHRGWNRPFTVDVTAAARWGAPNLLAVLADNSQGGGGGIWRPVTLFLPDEAAKREAAERAQFRKRLAAIPYDLVYETFRDNNWEIYRIRPDGSHAVNLTRTPGKDELYPHVSPNGTRICFSLDEGKGRAKRRSVYYMNIDGSGRTLVARHARQACWSPDGRFIAYLNASENHFVYTDYATRGIMIYDLATGKVRAHPNPKIRHLYNLCWSPDGRWFLATVHAGMGYGHAILAIQVYGKKVYNLGIPGCRPDISPDGRKVAWGASDWVLETGRLDFSGPQPRVLERHPLVESRKPMKVYHVDWSPGGRFIAFSRGPNVERLGHAPEIVGIKARGWNICIADAAATNRWAAVTTDGACDKEPDWIPVPRKEP